MKLKYLFLSMLALSLFAFPGCQEDDDDHMHEDNEITIRILEPEAGETLTDAKKVHIHVEIEASDENHEYEIEVYAHGDMETNILEVDEHNHDQLIEFEQDLDLSSFPSGQMFHLDVKACADHDCEKEESKEIMFFIE